MRLVREDPTITVDTAPLLAAYQAGSLDKPKFVTELRALIGNSAMRKIASKAAEGLMFLPVLPPRPALFTATTTTTTTDCTTTSPGASPTKEMEAKMEQHKTIEAYNRVLLAENVALRTENKQLKRKLERFESNGAGPSGA